MGWLNLLRQVLDQLLLGHVVEVAEMVGLYLDELLHGHVLHLVNSSVLAYLLRYKPGCLKFYLHLFGLSVFVFLHNHVFLATNPNYLVFDTM